MKMKLYRVTTTFLGADAPSKVYFNTQIKARDFLGIPYQKALNGEIETVNVIADYPLNYFDGCTMNDLTYGDFNAKEVEMYPVIYEAGESLSNPGEGVDFMLCEEFGLYAEMANSDDAATFEPLKEEIISQAEDKGIDPDCLDFD